MKALFIICNNPSLDLVGYHFFNYLKQNYKILVKNIDAKGNIESYQLKNDEHEFHFMITKKHVMHNFNEFVDYLNEQYHDIDICVHVNYHEGENALDNILTVHSVGDIQSGTFLPTMPKEATRLLLELQKHNYLLDLNFKVTTETTHYSGVISGNKAQELYRFKKPTYDLEIGSSPAAYENPLAIKALCLSIFNIFNLDFDTRLNVLYLGGTFFEDTLNEAILRKNYPIYYDHHLAASFIEDANYYENGLGYIEDIIKKSFQTVDLIVYHDKVRKIKPILDIITNKYGIPSIKHRVLRNIEEHDEIVQLYRNKL
ncbi:MAG: D-aminoacyl-tRNA deacylase [Bacilli bacterium]|jgi:D-tyrosyl-tRNA(Tyr) deacylase|nr:D-aminoacyl-tRNA deacylase [Bacilli bacterium]